jgi:Tfp pilus assembly protein PilF
MDKKNTRTPESIIMRALTQKELAMRCLLHLLYSIVLVLTLHAGFVVPPVAAQIEEPLWSSDEAESQKLDELKSADELIAEADYLLDDQRLLDARTKLLRALKQDPKNYRAHIMLSGYYLIHVGHFRLALRYIRAAEQLFFEQHGKPPYFEPRPAAEHAQILYLISQARLNLDDYQGALKALDEFDSWHYQAAWYPGTRAWILMKLGQIEEAIRVAREGVLAGAEPGRTLNMLGILLSMHGEPQEALAVFRDAIGWELSQGSLGQPATPLNNSGEVYKEIFMDEKAESSWLRATGMPDGCEHILPALNVSLLYFEQMNLEGAKKAFDAFESCVAQYPLRNGEEHKALLTFGRGRILLLSGKPEAALVQFEQANKDRQWFGKIGTSEDDLKAALLQSLAQAHDAIAHRLSFTIVDSWFDSLFLLQEQVQHSILSWWYERKGRRLLIENLKNIEDIAIRNTDALLEYPTLGTLLRGLSPHALQQRINQEVTHDLRTEARVFYDAYLGENKLFHGDTAEGVALLSSSLRQARSHFDDLFMAHLKALLLESLDRNGDEYHQMIQQLFELNRVVLRYHGLVLPVRFKGTLTSEQLAMLGRAGLTPTTSETAVEITFSQNDGILTFEVTAPMTAGGRMQLKGEQFTDLVNRLTEHLFSIDISV